MFILITDVVIVVERLTVRVERRTSNIYRVPPRIASIRRHRPIVVGTSGRIHRRAVRLASNTVQRVVFTRMIVIHIEIVLLTWRPFLGAVRRSQLQHRRVAHVATCVEVVACVASSNTSRRNVKSKSFKGEKPVQQIHRELRENVRRTSAANSRSNVTQKRSTQRQPLRTVVHTQSKETTAATSCREYAGRVFSSSLRYAIDKTLRRVVCFIRSFRAGV